MSFTGPIASPYYPVGARLKRLRLQLGISQRELARRADITNANLSQIEKDVVSPSLSTLEKILRALGVGLAEFFNERAEAVPAVVSSEALMRVQKNGSSYHVLPVTEARGAPVHLLHQTLAPGTRTGADWSPHSAALAGFVVSGELTLTLDGGTAVLLPGDAFHFAVHRRFVLQNTAQVPCELVVVSLDGG